MRSGSVRIRYRLRRPRRVRCRELIRILNRISGTQVRAALSGRFMLPIFAENKKFLERKFEDHREFAAVMLFLASLYALAFWIWDFVTDPVNASNTVWLRIGMMSVLATPPLLFKLVRTPYLVIALYFLSIFSAELIFVMILNRLHTGMTYGIGGFMVFMFMPVLALAGLSMRLKMLATVGISAMPQVLALMGIAHGFQHGQYAALIWPTAVVISLTHVAFDRTYALRYAAERALENSSNTDALTGLANRRHFMPTLKHEVIRACRQRTRTSLLMLDIDHFKSVNDKHGHPTGDLVICALAEICKNSVRTIDMAARLGGEEFAVLLVDADKDAALAVAERIRATVEQHQMTSCNGVPLRFTVSIGLCEQLPEEENEGPMIERADAALYQAKNTGRNKVVAYQAAS